MDADIGTGRRPQEYEAVCALFRALAAPVRAAIVHELTGGSRSVHELVELLGVSQPLISQHLKVLREASLVSSERRGHEVVSSLVDDHVTHVFLDAWSHVQQDHVPA